MCRATGLSFDAMTGRMSLRSGEQHDDVSSWLQSRHILLRLLLFPLWATSLAVGDLVLLLMRPLDIALEQALESVFSRGPV